MFRRTYFVLLFLLSSLLTIVFFSFFLGFCGGTLAEMEARWVFGFFFIVFFYFSFLVLIVQDSFQCF
ncbi:hypothetical protein C1646_689448 [Rhizophagus diaphanus]|nr:hypothetical protein C1646_689448 [Rhizophagus diaphanus] [Rhizophagus sp. MUCL 43196]